MASRNTFSGASTDVPWANTTEVPEGFGDQYARLIRAVLDASVLPLTAVGGTADDVTATCALDLPGYGLLDGMKFTLTWAEDNTGPMTLALNGGTAVPVLDMTGGNMIAGGATAGGRALLEYVGGDFRIINAPAAGAAAGPVHQVFTASGTWFRPDGYDDDQPVLIRAWGAGASGAKGSSAWGGGGGGYVELMIRWADLPAMVTVTIGDGGAARSSDGAGADGGDTSFGSLLTAYGGNAGGLGSGGAGGGLFGRGAGVSPLWSGADGGAAGADGGAAWLGGAGGAGNAISGGSRVGGVSRLAGNGGDGESSGGSNAALPGTAPGGGGGAGDDQPSGAGARGQLEVWIL